MLYNILKDRKPVNILKVLYDKELHEKRYALELKELLELTGFSSITDIPDRNISDSASDAEDPINVLKCAGLISAEYSEKKSTILSITQKGKEFMRCFDDLRSVLSEQKDKPKAYQVKYELTPIEQKILVMCSRIKAETGRIVSLNTLTEEVYPYDSPASRKGIVSKYTKALEELNLIIRIKDRQESFFDMTSSGERAVREQFLEAPTP